MSEQTHQLLLEIENMLSQVAEQAGNVVVSISTEKTARLGHAFYSFGDDTFGRFMYDFFYGKTPQPEYKQIGLGSGILINADGYILTNEHVISAADKITVTLADGRNFPAQLKGVDYRADLAVIKINSAKTFSFATLGDSDKIKAGQWAIAMGNPFGFAVTDSKPTITFGIISALHRSLPQTVTSARGYFELIQTDAAINPSNSGGPLVNIKGEVIGINMAIFSAGGGSDGIGFAIPINAAKAVLDKLLKGEEVLYGWLGIGIQDINAALAEYFGLKDADGVLISRVYPDSPAEIAGLRERDIILKFGGHKARNTLEFIKMVERSQLGQKVEIKVVRNKLIRTYTVEIGERPKVAKKPEQAVLTPQSPEHKLPPADFKLKAWKGLTIVPLDAQLALQYGIEEKTAVVVVTVEADSAAESAGIMPGDLILKIDTITILDINDYKTAIYNATVNTLVKTQRGYFVLKN
ncbi:MAG: trypsin-like peptidase domain-containing protein [Candidatus Omnitrophica bacterium]|nr:trypsin-like peptidase domain-containing protein [Candidatus Omnitrophota bacterium]